VIHLAIIVSDVDTAARWARRIEGLAIASPILLDDAAATGIDCGMSILVDIDLSDVVRLQTLIGVLSKARSAAASLRVFALDSARRLEVVQAEVLGATALLSRDPSPAEVAAALAGVRIPSLPAHSSEPVALRAGLDAGHALVAHVLAGRSADPAFVNLAARELARVIETEGIGPWIEAVRRHHEGTSQHCLLVSGLAMAFAAHLGFRREDRQAIGVAAALHDIGKAKIPLEVLDKCAPLTTQEWEVMRGHPVVGHTLLLEAGDHDELTLDVVMHHHERLDGSGYPHGISGKSISDPTRIISIVDVFGALLETRAYKPPQTAREAFANLQSRSGELDDALVLAFRPVALGSGYTEKPAI
jgi:putative nucleotidyltransferase with HDIG domain